MATKDCLSNHGIFTDLNIFITADFPGRLRRWTGSLCIEKNNNKKKIVNQFIHYEIEWANQDYKLTDRQTDRETAWPTNQPTNQPITLPTNQITNHLTIHHLLSFMYAGAWF